MTHDHVIGEGDLLPDVALVDHEGAPFRFSDHRGDRSCSSCTATLLDCRARNT